MQYLDLKLCSLKIWMLNKSLIVLLKLPFIREINIQNFHVFTGTQRLGLGLPQTSTLSVIYKQYKHYFTIAKVGFFHFKFLKSLFLRKSCLFSVEAQPIELKTFHLR